MGCCDENLTHTKLATSLANWTSGYQHFGPPPCRFWTLHVGKSSQSITKSHLHLSMQGPTITTKSLVVSLVALVSGASNRHSHNQPWYRTSTPVLCVVVELELLAQDHGISAMVMRTGMLRLAQQFRNNGSLRLGWLIGYLVRTRNEPKHIFDSWT